MDVGYLRGVFRASPIPALPRAAAALAMSGLEAADSLAREMSTVPSPVAEPPTSHPRRGETIADRAISASRRPRRRPGSRLRSKPDAIH